MSGLIFFYDTETTGVFNRGLPHEHPSQPNLVQLGALLVTDMGREVASASLIVTPEGYEIPSEAARVHGITTEIARDCGVPLPIAVGVFSNLRARAQELVAFNLDFDQAVMHRSFLKLRATPAHPGPDKKTCCMKMAAPVLNIPPTQKMLAAGFNTPKMPNLAQAYEMLFKEPMGNAHDALVDARACARIFFRLRERELERSQSVG